jgi:hypothetical protein
VICRVGPGGSTRRPRKKRKKRMKWMKGMKWRKRRKWRKWRKRMLLPTSRRRLEKVAWPMPQASPQAPPSSRFVP